MFHSMPMHKPRHIFRSQSGAFDLPSIMIGVAVVAILTVGVLAAIFGVIPWSQDKAAQQDLGAVHTAQGAAFAKDGGFMSRTGLASAGFLVDDPDDGLEIRASSDGRKYVGVSTSATGKKFMISAEAPTSRPLTNQDKWPDGQTVDPSAPDAPAVEAGPADNSAILATYTCGPAELVITQAMQDHSDANQALKDEAKTDEMTPYPGGGWMIIVDLASLVPGASGAALSESGVFDGTYQGLRNDSGYGFAMGLDGGMQLTNFRDGLVHSDQGPAIADCSAAGLTETWYESGRRHRVGEAAEISYSSSGKLAHKAWFSHGAPHRTEGPAQVYFDESESPYLPHADRGFYLNGVSIKTFEEWVAAHGVPEAWID